MYSLIVAGGRDFKDRDTMKEALNEFCTEHDIDAQGIEIVSGTARGADMLGASVARKAGIPVKEFPADWKDLNAEPCVIKSNQYGQYNALAGHNRNARMAEYADGLLAFWDGRSSGTNNMIQRMQKMGKTVVIVKY